MPDPTAATFRNPLLVAIGKATSNTPGTPASTNMVMLEVCREMGITEDQYGNDPMGRPKVRMWVLQAFNKILKEEGLAEGVSKGQWTLTAKGAEVLGILNGTPTIPGPEDVTEASCVIAPVPTALDCGEGVSWSLGPMKNTYSKDSYVLGLAVKSTPCFGCWSPDEGVCVTCPILGACQAKVLAGMSAIVAELTRAPDAPKPDSTDPFLDGIIDMIKNADAKPVVPSKPPVPVHKEMKASASTVCGHCAKPINMNTPMVHVRATDATDGVTGAFHPECFEERYGA